MKNNFSIFEKNSLSYLVKNIGRTRFTFCSKKQTIRTHDMLENREYAHMLFQIPIKNTAPDRKILFQFKKKSFDYV